MSGFLDDFDAPLGPKLKQFINSRDVDDSVLTAPYDHCLVVAVVVVVVVVV